MFSLMAAVRAARGWRGAAGQGEATDRSFKMVLGFGLGCGYSFSRRLVKTMSTIAGTVSVRAQSRCSSQASETQLIGCPPARLTRSSPARWASGEVPAIASTTG